MILDDLNIFIENFLNARTDESSNLPDGRYIYNYKMTTEEYENLITILQQINPTIYQHSSYITKEILGKGYCLFGSEYFRRSGKLEWGPLDQCINWNLTFRNTLIKLGLQFWEGNQTADNNIFRRPFLIEKDNTTYWQSSLISQGGICLQQRRFNSYVKKIQNIIAERNYKGNEDFALWYGMVERSWGSKGGFPTTRQVENFYASAAYFLRVLTSKISYLEVKKGYLPAVQDLWQDLENVLGEGWTQTDLPIYITNDDIQTLQRTTEQARTISSRFLCKTYLVSKSHELLRTITSPNSLSADDFKSMANIEPSDLGIKVFISCKLDNGNFVDIGRYRKSGAFWIFTLEENSILNTTSELRLYFETKNQIFDIDSNFIKNGEDLLDGPYAFETQTTTKNEIEVHPYIGSGSLNTELEDILVAVGNTYKFENNQFCQNYGNVHGIERTLYRIRITRDENTEEPQSINCVNDNVTYKFTVGCKDPEQNYETRLIGEKYHTNIYQDQRFYKALQGFSYKSRQKELTKYKIEGQSYTWNHNTSLEGRVYLFLEDDNVCLNEVEVLILPKNFAIQYNNNTISISGERLVSIRLYFGSTEIESTNNDNTWTFSLLDQNTSEQVCTIHFDFTNGSHFTMAYLIPFTNHSKLIRDLQTGTVFEPNSYYHVKHALRAKLQYKGKVILSLSLQTAGQQGENIYPYIAKPLQIPGKKLNTSEERTVSLSKILTNGIETLFSTSERFEDHVRLTITENFQDQRYDFLRFEGRFRLEDSSLFFDKNPLIKEQNLSDILSLEVRAYPLRHMTCTFLLKRIEDHWEIPDLPSGSWLITAQDKDRWHIIQPRVYVSKSEEIDNRFSGFTELQKAIELNRDVLIPEDLEALQEGTELNEIRRMRIYRYFTELFQKTPEDLFTDDDWKLIERYIEILGEHLPPICVDIFRCLAMIPKAVAIILLSLSPRKKYVILQLFGNLPFSFNLIGSTQWEEAFKYAKSYYAQKNLSEKELITYIHDLALSYPVLQVLLLQHYRLSQSLEQLEEARWMQLVGQMVQAGNATFERSINQATALANQGTILPSIPDFFGKYSIYGFNLGQCQDHVKKYIIGASLIGINIFADTIEFHLEILEYPNDGKLTREIVSRLKIFWSVDEELADSIFTTAQGHMSQPRYQLRLNGV